MFAKLYAIFGCTVLGGAVYADVCHTPHHQTIYQNQHGVAVVAPLVLPLYGASYTGETDNESKELLRQILETQKAILEKLTAGGGTGPVGSLAVSKPDGLKVMEKNCAGCHTAGKVKGDFEMYDAKGQMLKLNGPDKKEIAKRVANGTMPPVSVGRLTQGEKDSIKEFVESPPAKMPVAK